VYSSSFCACVKAIAAKHVACLDYHILADHGHHFKNLSDPRIILKHVLALPAVAGPPIHPISNPVLPPLADFVRVGQRLGLIGRGVPDGISVALPFQNLHRQAFGGVFGYVAVHEPAALYYI
jgi:hypothetical protein